MDTIAVVGILGILFIGMGVYSWAKKDISLLHSYHRRNVSPEDVPALARVTGISNIVAGAGCILMGVLEKVSPTAGPVIGAAVLFAGLGIGIYGIIKYNGKLFS